MCTTAEMARMGQPSRDAIAETLSSIPPTAARTVLLARPHQGGLMPNPDRTSVPGLGSDEPSSGASARKPILATMPGPDPLWNRYVEDNLPPNGGTLSD